MIEIKNTKVRLYTVEEFKNRCNVSVLIPEIERILELSKDKEIILISQLMTMTDQYPKYAAAISVGNDYRVICYEYVIINPNIIKEVITDEPKEEESFMKQKIEEGKRQKGGKTLLDDFTGQALQVLLTGEWEDRIDDVAGDFNISWNAARAKLCYDIAEAMVKEKRKREL